MTTLTLRPAAETDKTAVSQLSAHIWEGDDYIPRVFDMWLQDPDGQFIMAYLENELVGFGKLTRLANHEWWLEGLRVSIHHRAAGIGRALHNRGVELADELGSGTLRFMTAGSNHAIHKLAQETGFTHITSFWAADYELTAAEMVTAVTYSPFTSATPADHNALTKLLPPNALLEYRWKLYELHPRLPELLTASRVWWWHGANAAAAEPAFLITTTIPEREQMILSYFQAPAALWPHILRDVPKLAVAHQTSRIHFKAVVDNTSRQAIDQAGWSCDYDFQAWAFARPLKQQKEHSP